VRNGVFIYIDASDSFVNPKIYRISILDLIPQRCLQRIVCVYTGDWMYIFVRVCLYVQYLKKNLARNVQLVRSGLQLFHFA
jgi:hypothetical protein